ncbi:MAG: hypothetical protein ACFFC7_11860 [Candidatus Hermodarchaeota archaeon]
MRTKVVIAVLIAFLFFYGFTQTLNISPVQASINSQLILASFITELSWEISTVDPGNTISSSLAFNGLDNPAISYYDITGQDLKYASWNGIAWEITTVDSSGNVGRSINNLKRSKLDII